MLLLLFISNFKNKYNNYNNNSNKKVIITTKGNINHNNNNSYAEVSDNYWPVDLDGFNFKKIFNNNYNYTVKQNEILRKQPVRNEMLVELYAENTIFDEVLLLLFFLFLLLLLVLFFVMIIIILIVFLCIR